VGVEKLRKFMLLVIILLTIAGCGLQNEIAVRHFFAMDTINTITLYGVDRHRAETLLDYAERLVAHYEGIFSKTMPGSEIYKINNRTQSEIEVSAEVRHLVERSLQMSRLTDGLFDITIEPISALWNFSGEDRFVPEYSAIAKAMQGVGFENVMLTENTIIFKDSRTRLDLGAVAKGFIADRIGSYFAENGVERAIINLGGDILTIGGRTNTEPWRIGVRNPADLGELSGTLMVRGRAVASSGVYERQFETGGRVYHHILNPRTGYPVQTDLASVTIVADTALEGDLLSTAALLLGLDDGILLIESIEGVEGVFITDDGRVVVTDNLGNIFIKD